MPKTFAVTQVSSRLALDAQGQGKVTFNVANTTSQPLRGRVTPVALPPAKGEWLSMEGENERAFAAEQTHQFTVLVSAPPGTPPGSYSLRLDCVATHNPDELFTEGPVVAFEVAPPVIDKKCRWCIPALVAAVLLLVVGAVWWFGFRDTRVLVPDVIGKAVDQAREGLAQAGLLMDEQVIEDFTETPAALPPGVATFPPPAGVVLRTAPPAGQKVAPRSTVQLTVEVESTTVPKLTELTTESAITKMRQAKLTLGDLSFGRSIPAQARQVIAQDPAPQTRRPVGSPVQIVVGTGILVFGDSVHFKASQVLSGADMQAVQEIAKTNDFKRKWRQLEPPPQ